MPLPKRWLSDLVNDVSPSVMSWNSDVRLQCHVYQNSDEEQDEWEVTLFGEPQTFGGRLKPFSYEACLTIDVLSVTAAFEEIHSCHWQTGTVDSSDELGPHLAVCGSYQGNRVWLRLLGQAPERLRAEACSVPKYLTD